MFSRLTNNLWHSVMISSSSHRFINPVAIDSVFKMQTMEFSKLLSKSRAKRQPMTTKRAGKGFYKGNRSRKEGRLTSKGKFVRDKELLLELVVPDLKYCQLRPYVGFGAKRHMIESKVELTL